MASVLKIACVILLLCFAIIEASHEKSVKKSSRKHLNHRSSDQCRWICPETGNYIEEVFRVENLLIYKAVSSNIAIVLDLDHYYLIGIDGALQTVIIHDLHSKVYYNVQNSQVAWNNSDSFTTYYHAIHSFESVVQLAQQNGQNGQKIADISQSVLQEYTKIVYSVGFSAKFTKEVLLFYVNTLPNLIDLLNGPLQGYLQDASSTIKSIHGVDFQANLIFALGSLFSHTSGGLPALQRQGVKLDYNLLMNVNSGIEVLLIVLENVGEHANLVQVFGSVLTEPLQILQFVVLLNSPQGVDPILNIIYNFIQVAQGHGSINSLIDLLRTTLQNFNPVSFTTELQGLLREILQIVQTQTQHYNNAPQLQGIINFIRGLLNNNLTIGNVNVSELIQTIIGNVPNIIQRIVKVLSSLPNNANALSAVFREILEYVRNNIGAITELFPGLHINGADISSILEEIIENFNIGDIFNGSGGNILTILSRLPVIGDIIKEIQGALPSGNIQDLQRIFNLQNIIKIAQNVFEQIQGGNTNFEDIIRIIIQEIVKVLQSSGNESGSSESNESNDSGSGSSEKGHHHHNNGKGHPRPPGRGKGNHGNNGNNGHGNNGNNGNGNNGNGNNGNGP